MIDKLKYQITEWMYRLSVARMNFHYKALKHEISTTFYHDADRDRIILLHTCQCGLFRTVSI